MGDEVSSDNRLVGLGPIQRQLLGYLESCSFGQSVYEIGSYMLWDGESEAGEAELRSIYIALVRLEHRGLVSGRWTWIRDHGRVLVWRSHGDPARKVYDPGG